MRTLFLLVFNLPHEISSTLLSPPHTHRQGEGSVLLPPLWLPFPFLPPPFLCYLPLTWCNLTVRILCPVFLLVVSREHTLPSPYHSIRMRARTFRTLFPSLTLPQKRHVTCVMVTRRNVRWSCSAHPLPLCRGAGEVCSIAAHAVTGGHDAWVTFSIGKTSVPHTGWSSIPVPIPYWRWYLAPICLTLCHRSRFVQNSGKGWGDI